MPLLATSFPSEAIDPEVFVVAASLFYSACLAGLIALIAMFTLRGATDLVLALSTLAIVLAIFPFLFCCHIYAIDYVAVGGDGTPASPPFWRALWVPALPAFAGSALTVLSYSSKRRKLKISRRLRPQRT